MCDQRSPQRAAHTYRKLDAEDARDQKNNDTTKLLIGFVVVVFALALPGLVVVFLALALSHNAEMNCLPHCVKFALALRCLRICFWLHVVCLTAAGARALAIHVVPLTAYPCMSLSKPLVYPLFLSHQLGSTVGQVGHAKSTALYPWQG